MNGIDISSHQAGINLSALPCDFVIVKATEGTSYLNPYFKAQSQQTLNLGKKLGIYHFASGGNAISEADYFIENIKQYKGKSLLVLDWEADAINCGVIWAKQWLDRVYTRTGVKPLIYMSNSVVSSYDWSAVAASGYGLWNAGYYAGYQTMGYNPDAPIYGGLGAWGNCVMYQYTSSGRLPGWEGNLDLDVFYGDKKAWDLYTGGSGNASDSYAGGSGNASDLYAGGSGNAADQNTGAAEVSGQSNKAIVDFVYAVRVEGKKKLSPVTNLEDFAGIRGRRITDIAIKVNKGKVRYRIHLLGGSWFPWVTGYNWKDYENGYAGNGQPIDGIQVYYETPTDIVAHYGYQKAQYRVSPLNRGYYSWQYDTETGNGQDGYAGVLGQPMDRFQLF